jgi:hypothetical protein
MVCPDVHSLLAKTVPERLLVECMKELIRFVDSVPIPLKELSLVPLIGVYPVPFLPVERE